MKKSFMYLILFILPFVACEKVEYAKFSSSIIGEWTWLSTCGGFSGLCDTPKSEKDKINLVFTVDSICNLYHADTLSSSSRFHVYKLIYADDPEDTMNILQYDHMNQYFNIYDDRLYLSPVGADFGSDYKRVR